MLCLGNDSTHPKRKIGPSRTLTASVVAGGGLEARDWHRRTGCIPEDGPHHVKCSNITNILSVSGGKSKFRFRKRVTSTSASVCEVSVAADTLQRLSWRPRDSSIPSYVHSPTRKTSMWNFFKADPFSPWGCATGMCALRRRHRCGPWKTLITGQ